MELPAEGEAALREQVSRQHRGVLVGVQATDTQQDRTTGSVDGEDTFALLAAGQRARAQEGHGYPKLLAWTRSLGTVRAVGIEGTGSYGVGLFRYLVDEGIKVLEVDRANRKMRRLRGKSDTVDAEAVARAVRAGTATPTPKARNGMVETRCAIKTARGSAVRAHTAAKNALLSLCGPPQSRCAHRCRGCPADGWSRSPPRCGQAST